MSSDHAYNNKAVLATIIFWCLYGATLPLQLLIISVWELPFTHGLRPILVWAHFQLPKAQWLGYPTKTKLIVPPGFQSAMFNYFDYKRTAVHYAVLPLVLHPTEYRSVTSSNFCFCISGFLWPYFSQGDWIAQFNLAIANDNTPEVQPLMAYVHVLPCNLKTKPV